MTFTEIELTQYTESIISKTIESMSLAFMALVLFYQLTSFGLWLYQRRLEKK